MRRSAAGALAILAALALPGQAAAHSGTTRGTDYRSVVLSAPPGVEAHVVGGDDRLVVRRLGDETVVVLGYEGEPYLRLDGSGVWENDNSPAVILNGRRRPTADEVERARRRAPGAPVWKRIGGGDTAVFHDHRTHWMGSSPPLTVRSAPGREQTVFRWAVPVQIGDERAAIRGRLDYVPPPSNAWWLLAAGASVAAFAAAALSRGRGGIWPDWVASLVAIAAATAVSAAADLNLPSPGSRLVTSAVLPLLAGAVALGLALRLDRAVAALLLFVTVAAVAGGSLVARLPASFDHGVIPSELPANAVRALLVAGLAGLAYTAGALLPLVFGWGVGRSRQVAEMTD